MLVVKTSFNKNTPKIEALIGIKNVTSKSLTAPMAERSLKYITYAIAVENTANSNISLI